MQNKAMARWGPKTEETNLASSRTLLETPTPSTDQGQSYQKISKDFLEELFLPKWLLLAQILTIYFEGL